MQVLNFYNKSIEFNTNFNGLFPGTHRMNQLNGPLSYLLSTKTTYLDNGIFTNPHIVFSLILPHGGKKN